jgi:carboxylesterase type B
MVTFNSYAAEHPVVQITAGQLQGATEHNMQVFKGIPYASSYWQFKVEATSARFKLERNA